MQKKKQFSCISQNRYFCNDGDGCREIRAKTLRAAPFLIGSSQDFKIVHQPRFQPEDLRPVPATKYFQELTLDWLVSVPQMLQEERFEAIMPKYISVDGVLLLPRVY